MLWMDASGLHDAVGVSRLRGLDFLSQFAEHYSNAGDPDRVDAEALADGWLDRFGAEAEPKLGYHFDDATRYLARLDDRLEVLNTWRDDLVADYMDLWDQRRDVSHEITVYNDDREGRLFLKLQREYDALNAAMLQVFGQLIAIGRELSDVSTQAQATEDVLPVLTGMKCVMGG